MDFTIFMFPLTKTSDYLINNGFAADAIKITKILPGKDPFRSGADHPAAPVTSASLDPAGQKENIFKKHHPVAAFFQHLLHSKRGADKV